MLRRVRNVNTYILDMRKYGQGRIQDYLIVGLKFSDVVDLINVPYLLYKFGQTDLSKECTDYTPQMNRVDKVCHIPISLLHSQIVKWTF